MNVIECKQLTKSYGQLKALDKLSLTIQENKITGLIGRNGAEYIDVELSTYKNDFSTRQFTGEKLSQD